MKNLSVDALLSDEEFLAWYYHPSPERTKMWEERMLNQDELKSLVPVAIQILEHILKDETQVTEAEMQMAQNQLMQRVHTWQEEMPPTRKSLWPHWWWVSACMLLMVGYFIKNTFSRKIPDTFSSISTIRQITLSDSTRISLNAGSTIRISNFEDPESDREVWLEGEAYFDVAHTSNHRKFIVHSGDMDVEVLGTQFNIRKGQEKTEVMLETGQVRLTTGSTGTHTMKPGEMVQYSAITKKLTMQEVNPETYTSWKDADIIFENADAEEITRVLREVFKLKVILEGSHDLGQFNGTFSSKDPEVLLRALEKTYDGHIHRQSGKITIK
jgi:transmembrane sensor